MRRVVVSAFLSLDGVMQAPGAAEEDTEGGFRHGGWQMSYSDEELGRLVSDVFDRTYGLLLGRVTYEIFAGYWPTAPAEEEPLAGQLNRMPKFVASRTLHEATWQNTTLLKGDIAEAVAALKVAGDEGDLMVVGSGKLAQTLIARDLVDEYILWIYPLVLGNGKRLFAEGLPRMSLQLVESRTTSKGVVVLTYRPER